MNKRLLSLDVIKMIAIIFVVYCHTITTQNIDEYALLLKITRVMGVPLFVMCTGALLLNRDFKTKESFSNFYSKNFFSLLITSWIWYLIYMIIYEYNSLSLSLFLKTLLFINKPSDHLWYLRMILIYYSVMPIIAYIRKEFKITYYTILILTISYIYYNTTRLMINGNEYPTLSGISILVYLGYMEIGALAIQDSKPIKIFFIVLGILSFIILFIYQKYSSFFLWYDNILVAFESIGIYAAINLLINNNNESQFITYVSKTSFGIYLIHVIFINIIKDIYFINNTLTCLLQGLIAILISISSIKIINYNKFLSKILFRN